MINKAFLTITLMLCTYFQLAQAVNATEVVLKTRLGCPACAEANQELTAAHIKYVNLPATTGNYVPQLYVNGMFCGYGTDTVEAYIRTGDCIKHSL